MKKMVYLGASLALIMGIMVGCERDPKNKSSDMDNHLTLHEVKRAYYDNNNNRYESGQFNADHQSYDYSLESISGNKYRVMLHGIDVSNVTLELRDGENKFIKEGEQANVGFTAQYFVFESEAEIDYQIHIETSDKSVYDKDFYLTFEEIGTYFLSWKGKNWLCDGDWEVNEQNQLVHVGSNSGFSKWVKIADETFNQCNLSLEFEVPTSEIVSPVGIAVNASDKIFEMINLPEESRQFKVLSSNEWEFWRINMKSTRAISREIGVLDKPFNNGYNQLECFVKSNSIICSVNGDHVFDTSNDLKVGLEPRFYITVEDIGEQTTVFNDIEVN